LVQKARALGPQALFPSVSCETIFRRISCSQSGREPADELLDAGPFAPLASFVEVLNPAAPAMRRSA
jgi:hypothetical protein